MKDYPYPGRGSQGHPWGKGENVCVFLPPQNNTNFLDKTTPNHITKDPVTSLASICLPNLTHSSFPSLTNLPTCCWSAQGWLCIQAMLTTRHAYIMHTHACIYTCMHIHSTHSCCSWTLAASALSGRTETFQPEQKR